MRGRRASRLPGARLRSWQALELGGRPAVATDHIVAVLYDEQTLVVLSASGLARSDLLAAAASLVPGDPSVPRPVAADPGLCDGLGMCG